MMNGFVLLACIRVSTNNLVVRRSSMSTNAHVLPELARRQPSFEHLVYLFERPVLDLWKVKVDPDGGKEARRSPDPAYHRVSTLINRKFGELAYHIQVPSSVHQG